MARRCEATFVYRGRDITAEYDACPAEPDVGIMSDYADSCSVVEIDGVGEKEPGFAELLESIEGETFEQDIQEECSEAAYDALHDDDWPLD